MKKGTPRIEIRDSAFDNNGKAGVRIEGACEALVENVTAEGNGEIGLSIGEGPRGDTPDSWYKRPVGIVCLTVVAGLIIEALTGAGSRVLKWAFRDGSTAINVASSPPTSEVSDSRLLTVGQKAKLLSQSEGKRVTLVCEPDTSGSCPIADDYAAFLKANGRQVARQYYDPQEYRRGVNFIPDNKGREVRIVVSGPPI